MEDRRLPPTSGPAAAPPASALASPRPIDWMRPVYAPDAPDHPLGVVYLRGPTRIEGESYFVVHYHGVPTLVAGRRVNRVTDPCALYILADGSIWIGQPAASAPVVAEVALAPP